MAEIDLSGLGGEGGRPAIKFRAVGDYVDLGLVEIVQVPSLDYDTGQPAMWQDGTPKKHHRITGIVVSHKGGFTGKVKKPETHLPVNTGDVVTIHAQGSAYFAFRDAVAAYKPEVPRVGDVLRWTLDSTVPAKNPNHEDRRVWSAAFRAAVPEDGDLRQRCEAAGTVAAAPAFAGGGDIPF